MRELGRRDSRGGEQGWQGWRGRPSSLWCQGVRCCVVPPWPDSGARLRPSCRPQPAIPAGWIWFYWFDPVSEWLLEAAAAAPAPAPAAAAAAARRSAAAAAVRPAFLLLLPPPTNTGPCAAPPTAAGYSLYGLVASQLGDVTTPTTLPDGGVRGRLGAARRRAAPARPAPWHLPRWPHPSPAQAARPAFSSTSFFFLSSCPSPQAQPVNQFIQGYFGFKRSFMWPTAAVLLAFLIFFRLLALLGLAKLNFQRR